MARENVSFRGIDSGCDQSDKHLSSDTQIRYESKLTANKYKVKPIISYFDKVDED